MPIYQQEPENDSPDSLRRQPYQSFGCSLLHFGPIALYCSVEVLERDVAKLTSETFKIQRFDCSKWDSPAAVHRDLQAALGFPDDHGQNLGALSDSFRGVQISDDAGTAMVLLNYHAFTTRDREHATAILDVLATSSRLLQIFGKTLIALVQTDDPDADYGKLGAVRAFWNQNEFLRERRLDTGAR